MHAQPVAKSVTYRFPRITEMYSQCVNVNGFVDSVTQFN